ncbi:PREDICTED: L-xylulose reductase-like [Wasmannia auropunctata]|uniref:L-xylulose reductase-like n=1 Tax=Wasmannia auropunctata TaxID=64793 RepID=UPI0005ED874D|nr:PREDICTED: L-xylulose reductase-like [Wasmannia auropunctata]
MSLAGKVVLITGASSEIGAATAVHLANLGARLSITDRNKESLDKIVEQCGQNKPFIVTGELTNESDVKNIIDSTIRHYGKLDVLVNNTGNLEMDGIETTSLKQYDDIFNVSVRSMYQLTTLAVPHLIKTKGNIVNVFSMAGLRVLPSNTLSYCMSKAAVDEFTRCIALELGPQQRSGMSEDQIKSFVEHNKITHALRRTDSFEVARTIAFLASDDAGSIAEGEHPTVTNAISRSLSLQFTIFRAVIIQYLCTITMSFAGKVVLITGASSGIGAATAIHLANLGATLSITGRDKKNLDKVAEQCGQNKPFIVTGELTNESDVKNIIDSTIRHYGCVALELAPQQVRVNAVNPGVVITKLFKRSGMSEDQVKSFFEHIKDAHPLGRTGDVSEVATTIAFLASDDASFITGATLPVDGGRHAMCSC